MRPADDPQAAEPRYRILVVLPDAGMGGGVRVVGELVREWVGMGLDVRTLSLSTSSATGREILRHAPHESLGARSSIQRLLQLRRYLRRTEHRYDIVFAIGDYSAVLALLARMLMRPRRRPKVVNGVHQPRPFITSIATSRRSRAVRWLAIHAVLGVLRGLDGYVFLNETQLEMYRGLGVPSNVARTVIPNPVRFAVADHIKLERRDARLRRGELVRLIAVGALNDQKNHLLMLDALNQLDGRFMLSIIGGGEREPALRYRISALHLDDRVHLLGPREDIDQLLDEHDIFVLSSDYEASPLVVLEAMVRGLPVVSTDCAPSSRELSSALPTFTVVDLKDSGELAAGVREVSRHPPALGELRRAAEMVFGTHSVSQSCERHIRFFRDV